MGPSPAAPGWGAHRPRRRRTHKGTKRRRRHRRLTTRRTHKGTRRRRRHRRLTTRRQKAGRNRPPRSPRQVAGPGAGAVWAGAEHAAVAPSAATRAGRVKAADAPRGAHPTAALPRAHAHTARRMRTAQTAAPARDAAGWGRGKGVAEPAAPPWGAAAAERTAARTRAAGRGLHARRPQAAATAELPGAPRGRRSAECRSGSVAGGSVAAGSAAEPAPGEARAAPERSGAQRPADAGERGSGASRLDRHPPPCRAGRERPHARGTRHGRAAGARQRRWARWKMGTRKS